MRSQLFAFNVAQTIQTGESRQDSEMTYDADAQVQVNHTALVTYQRNADDGDDQNELARRFTEYAPMQ